MLTQEIIRKKRDRAVLSQTEIATFVQRIARDEASPAQIAAFGMAVFLNGMNTEETVALTLAMRDSGTVIDWDAGALGGPVLDKHSTGGVGDKVSLMLAPMVAAAGGFVPMISGRGLGHTGGTLDKLASIRGYDTAPALSRFRKVVEQAGCAVIGQTEDLAPADRRFYAVRDVTATVESIPLITASILSKKLAAGLSGLAMDVKTGSGAFMETLDGSRALARSIVDVANGAGLPTTAVITDMDQVLGHSAGNAVEVRETIDYLTGERRDDRLHDVVRSCSAPWLRAPPPNGSSGWSPVLAGQPIYCATPVPSPRPRMLLPSMPIAPVRSRQSTHAASAWPWSSLAADAAGPRTGSIIPSG